MLSDGEIKILIEKGVLEETGFEERKGRSLFFFVNEKKQLDNKNDSEGDWDWDKIESQKIYFLGKIENDVIIKETIDEKCEFCYQQLIIENQDKIKRRIKLCLPYKETRLKEFENCFNEYLNLFKTENPYLEELFSLEDLETLIKKRYYSQLDKVLKYDEETGVVSFEFSIYDDYLEFLNLQEDEEMRQVTYLKTLEWIKEQILIEKGEANEPLPETIQTNNQKIIWKGTPGEFGAIFDLLIDNGFIELIKDKKNMVRLLHSLFEIKNKKGEVVSSDYLYDCFKDKIKSYPNGYLKIPFSDNYHNDK